MSTELFSYQKKGVRKITHFKGRALLADEMGLGKTLQALKWIAENEAYPAVVVCPAFLKAVWEREASHHLDVRSEICEGKSPPKVGRLHKVPKLTIVNYEVLSSWKDYILKMNPKCLVIDECHYIKNRGAQRTRATRQVAKNVPHVIGISGTPLKNRPVELFPVLNLIDPKRWPSFMAYAHRYCKPRRTPWGWDFRGAQNLEELNRVLNSSCMIRRLKADVLSELPPKRRMVVPLDIDNRGEYEEAVDDFLKWLQKQGTEKVKKAVKALELVRLGYLKRLAAKLKLKRVYEWVDTYLEGSTEKLVVFAQHLDVIDKLSSKYKNSVVVDGRVNVKKRKFLIHKFQNDPSIRIFIGNTQAAGVGINGLQVANSLAFVEMEWTPGDHMQAEDRVHRIGQTKQSTVYYLVAKDTIEERLCSLIQAKADVLGSVLDGHNDGDIDIFTQLVKMEKMRHDSSNTT
jgi:SNF2 family DNA or RNA helicase